MPINYSLCLFNIFYTFIRLFLSSFLYFMSAKLGAASFYYFFNTFSTKYFLGNVWKSMSSIILFLILSLAKLILSYKGMQFLAIFMRSSIEI